MLPNVNQLTQQLRLLPDAALQRVAQMYKQDPYILPMVVSEGMARKKLRAAGQAQAMQGTPPKVVDQAIASLGYTPEESGIAGLAAPNMQNMADGGIAGEADDFEFAQRSEPVVRMAGGGAVARYAGDSSSLVRLPNPAAQFYSSQLSPSSDPLTELHRQAYAFEAERIAAEKDLAAAEAVLQRYGMRQRQTDPEGYAQAVAARDAAAKRRDTAAKRYSQESGRLAPQDEAERAFKKPTAMTGEEAKLYAGLYENAPKAPLMPIPDVKIAGQTPPAAAGAQARPPAAPGIAAAPAATGPGRAEDILAKTEREGLRRLYNMQLDAERRGDEERIAYEAGKPKGEAYASMSERLKKMEEAEPKEREQAKGMAIFNAGLAMMAGSSPFAMQNIAKGALAGTGEYAGALKEFKQAAKERMKLEADIEQARRAEARGDNETALKLMQRQNDRVDRISDAMVDLGAKMGISKADVAAKVDLLRTELNSRERIAAAQLAQEPGDIRSLRALMADPNLLDMLRTSKTIGSESSLLQKMALEAAKDPAGFKAMEKLNPGAYAAVMAEVAKLGGTSSGVSPAESALIKQYLNKP